MRVLPNTPRFKAGTPVHLPLQINHWRGGGARTPPGIWTPGPSRSSKRLEKQTGDPGARVTDRRLQPPRLERPLQGTERSAFMSVLGGAARGPQGQ